MKSSKLSRGGNSISEISIAHRDSQSPVIFDVDQQVTLQLVITKLTTLRATSKAIFIPTLFISIPRTSWKVNSAD